MEKVKLLSLFSGIGAFEKALSNLKIDYELVGFSEIDKYAIESYSAIHNVDKSLNIGDISNVNPNDIEDFDLMTYGFPCQDVSIAGGLNGFKENSETRSSLLWEAMKIAKYKKPKYLVAENVRNLIGKKFKADFEKWMQKLEEMGYNSYYSILNAKDFNIPQNRERVFVVSIRKDIDNGNFKFPYGDISNTKLKDLLEENVDEKYNLSKEAQDRLKYQLHNENKEILIIKNATKRGYLEAIDGDGIDLAYPDSTTRRGRVQSQRSQTLTTSDNLGVVVGTSIRKFTPLECWRLMGFDDEDYNKANKTLSDTYYKGKNKADSQLYKQAGNSIVVNVLQYLLYNLLVKSETHCLQERKYI